MQADPTHWHDCNMHAQIAQLIICFFSMICIYTCIRFSTELLTGQGWNHPCMAQMCFQVVSKSLVLNLHALQARWGVGQEANEMRAYCRMQMRRRLL